MLNALCIIIPVHSSNPSRYELISFQQCFKILGKHSIKIIAPQGLNLDKYKNVIPEFVTVFIDPKWQSSITGYNKLKTSRFFYNLFSEYKYLLTYELDAFVFKDDLAYWCGKGYDYIGAPWFEGFDVSPENANLIGVGNSGFSLRKIDSVQNVLANLFYKNPSEYNSGYLNLTKAYIKMPFRWFMNQLGENYTVQNYYDYYEDIFFSFTTPMYFKNFKIAPKEEALKFSFEVKPERLFELNNHKLPMGCHAWWRYNLNFWRPFIEQYGYTL